MALKFKPNRTLIDAKHSSGLGRGLLFQLAATFGLPYRLDLAIPSLVILHFSYYILTFRRVLEQPPRGASACAGEKGWPPSEQHTQQLSIAKNETGKISGVFRNPVARRPKTVRFKSWVRQSSSTHIKKKRRIKKEERNFDWRREKKEKKEQIKSKRKKQTPKAAKPTPVNPPPNILERPPQKTPMDEPKFQKWFAAQQKHYKLARTAPHPHHHPPSPRCSGERRNGCGRANPECHTGRRGDYAEKLPSQ